MDLAGDLASAPVGSTPVGPLLSVRLLSVRPRLVRRRSTRRVSPTIPLSTIVPSICKAGVDCSTGTLGDAFTAGNLDPNATFSAPGMVAGMNAAGITINDIVVAMISAAGFPWELLPVQGLQPYSHTQPHVTYRISAAVDCLVLQTFTLRPGCRPDFSR